MRIRRIPLVVLITTVVLIVLLTWERVSLCLEYWRLVSNAAWKEPLHRLPRFETIARYDGASEDAVSMGYAELSGFSENIRRVSPERFPKITVEGQSVRLTILPPYQYGMDMFEAWLQERQPERSTRMTDLERERNLAACTRPYDQAREDATVVPLPLAKVAILPKRQLRIYIDRLQRKCYGPAQTILFECGPVKAVYEAYKKEFATLTVYDTDLYFVQWVIITLGSEGDRLNAARQVVSSLRFKMKALPAERDELLQIMREAMEKMPAYDPNSWNTAPTGTEREFVEKPNVPRQPAREYR